MHNTGLSGQDHQGHIQGMAPYVDVWVALPQASARYGDTVMTQRIEILVDLEDMPPGEFERLRRHLEHLVWNAVDVETGPLMVQANEVVAP